MTALGRAASLVHYATCRDNQHDGPESDYPCVELAREVLAAGQVEPKVHRLEVEHGDGLTSYPCAERVRGGWQCGVLFYPDSQVVKATPLTVQPAVSAEQLNLAAGYLSTTIAQYQHVMNVRGALRRALAEAGLTVAGESDE